MMDVGIGDFEHKGAATSDGLVSMGRRVAFCLDKLEFRKSRAGQWRPGLYRWPGHGLRAGR